jgi:hypothetical protein
MAEKIVSPGVFTKEIDASFLPAAIGDIGAVVVGPTVKGPILVPTVVNSYGEFQEKFGDTFKSGSGYYQYLTSHTAKNYLQHQGTLTVVRVAADGYSWASSSIGSSGADNSVAARGTLAIVGTFGTLVDEEVQITVGSTEYRFIAADPLAGLPDNASPIFFHSTGSNTADYLAQLTASINAADIGVSAFVGAAASATNLNLTASTAGTSGNSITVDSGSGGTYADAFDLAGGTDSTTGGGATFKLHTLATGDIMNSVSSDYAATNNILDSGSKDNVRWEISTKNDKKGTFTLLIRRGDDTIKRKQILETWNNLSLDSNQPNYIDKVVGDQKVAIGGDAADPFLTYTGNYQNRSKYVRVETILQTVDYLDDNGKVRVPDNSASLPAIGSGSSGGAFEGGVITIDHPQLFNEFITSANSQGLKTGVGGYDSYTKALNLLSNADEYDFNLLLIPGILRKESNHTAIISKAIDICESRGDAFVVIDTVAQDEESFSNVTDQAKAMDSNYAATYWPWIQTSDPQTGQNVWVPPSVMIAGVYAFNDKVAAPWNAPAGLNRGGMSTAIQAKRKLTHGNRDELYEKNVNPIATFPGQGVTVWGQKTLQKKASALDRVNVRRLMIKVKKFIAASSRFLVFEQNNAQTRERFLNIANPFLEQVQAQSGLNAFKVVMDDSNNTPDIVDRNILYGQIFVQPTKTAEFIVLDFTIQPTGAAFPE